MVGTPFWPLIATVFGTIFEVFLLCLAGFFLARNGILDKKTQKQLNRLNVSLFTPALLFSKVAFFLSPQKLRELWVIPIFFVIVTICSMVVASSLSFAFRLKPSQRSFAIAASMFMNSNSLPIALMQSLVITVPGLKWEADDNQDTMLGRALTYLVLYSTLGMMVRWSYGVKLLSQADPEGEPESGQPARLSSEEPLLSDDGVLSLLSESSLSDGEQGPRLRVSSHGPLLQVHRPRMFYSFPGTPAMSATQLSSSGEPNASDYETDPEGDELPFHRTVVEPASSRYESVRRRTKRRIVQVFRTVNEFMTVPLWASIASLFVACNGPLQRALNDIQPFKGALSMAGNCSVPLTLVVLGAYFYIPNEAGGQEIKPLLRQSESAASSRLSLMENVRDMFKMSRPSRRRKASIARNQSGETKTVIIAIVSRMVITPMLVMPLMVLSVKFDWQRVFSDPVFVVANVLLVSSPPALTLAQITQAASGDSFERLISRTIFWSYCVLTPPTIILNVVIGLILSRL